jgi:hypothetical protein
MSQASATGGVKNVVPVHGGSSMVLDGRGIRHAEEGRVRRVCRPESHDLVGR